MNNLNIEYGTCICDTISDIEPYMFKKKKYTKDKYVMNLSLTSYRYTHLRSLNPPNSMANLGEQRAPNRKEDKMRANSKNPNKISFESCNYKLLFNMINER